MNRKAFFGQTLGLTVIAFGAAFGLSLTAHAQLPDQASDFALLDHTGTFHQLSYFGDQQAVVIFAHSDSVPAASKGEAEFAQLTEKFIDTEVTFFMLNAVVEESRSSIQAQNSASSVAPILVDESQLVAETLGITHLTETLVIDPATMRIVLRGSLPDDTQELAAAISALVAAQEPESRTIPINNAELAISYPARDTHQVAEVSYTHDIVPILTENCVACHHEGGIGPWAMTEHAMVRGWSAMMREVVMTRRMPPGQIDTHVGKPIADVAGLTTAEAQKLIHWIDAGAPVDGDADPLKDLQFDNPKFSLGEPDLVYQVTPQDIPATGIIDYRYIPVELKLDRDVWVRAVEFVPGDREVLHHVIAYVSSPADRTVRGRETGAARGESVGGFAPGRQPDQFHDNSGRLLSKGSNLLLQMHYTTSGRETTDVTEVGIYLHDKPPQYVMSGGVAGQRRFFVPPNTKEHKLRGEQLIERDAYLYEMTPHMHFRGKYMSYTAEYPDGTSELLLSVPKYDFNWQFNYLLEEPLFLPAGTKLVANGAMDNSARNPGNPNPNVPVHFGLQTKHEMFFGFTTLRYVGDTPQTVASNKNAATVVDAGD